MNENKAEALFAVSNLRKNFPMPAGELHILKGVDFTLRAGEMAFIVGRSGSGKSTFLHLLGGLDHPNDGEILFEGQNITRLREPAVARIRNLRLGMVFQFYHLLPELTVYENVLLPMIIAGRKDPEWAKEVLKRVKLVSRQDYYPSQLSGGEKQRVAIARALANKPSVVLCDEPTGNLDEETAETVFSLIWELNKREGQAFVIVTHDENLAWRYPHRVYRLHEGIFTCEDRSGTNLQTNKPENRHKNAH